MKTATNEQIESIITRYQNSAYAYMGDIRKLARELSGNDDDIEEVEFSIFDDIDQALEGYSYEELEDQGADKRHIWHKIKTKTPVVKVWIAVKSIGNNEDITVFDSFDEISGSYDYTKEVIISKTTYNRLKAGYTPVRFGNTIRAYSM